MKMTDISVKKGFSVPFSMVPNATVNSKKLTLEELGLLTYLISKPDNWIIRPKDIQNNFGIGRDKAYKLINSLIEKRFIIRDEIRDENGKFKSVQFTIYDQPFPENPDTAKPDTVNQELNKKEDIQRKNTNTPKPPEGGDLFSEGEVREAKETKKERDEKEFQEFWKAYGKVGNTEPARKKYRIVRRELSQKDLLNAVSNYLSSLPDWQNPKHASTFLNQKIWKDYLDAEPDQPETPGAKARSDYGEAVIKWQKSGKIGPAPKIEDYEGKQ